MKVSREVSLTSVRLRCASAIAATLLLAAALIPAQASAITRPQIISRAKTWVRKHIKYSQSAYYAGYRRDCSGFVSMAWKLKTSYTSSTIAGVARRIAISKLLPGDAVRRPGHVEIFENWVSRKRRTYVALEESTWGTPAVRRVKRILSSSQALRYRHVTVQARPVAPAAPAIPPVSSLPTQGAIPTAALTATGVL